VQKACIELNDYYIQVDAGTSLERKKRGGLGGRPCYGRPYKLIRSDHLDFPVRNTWNDFRGFALLIWIESVLVPFLVGENVTVTVLTEFG
jgi:hypothetical protein